MITTLPPISILPQALASLGETSSVSSLNLQEETREFLFKTLIGGRLRAPLLGAPKDRLEVQTLAVRALRGRTTPGEVADRLWLRLAED